MNYLNETGLQYFWGKIKDYVAENAGSGGGGGTVNWSNIQGKPADLVTDVVISGSGNAVTNASFSEGTLTLTKGDIESGGSAGGDYLPLSGGTMSGDIIRANSGDVKRSKMNNLEISVYDSINTSTKSMLSITSNYGVVEVGNNLNDKNVHIDANTGITIKGSDMGVKTSTGGNASTCWTTNGGTTTFKTVNGESLLGSGDIVIPGGSGGDGNNFPTSISTMMTTNSTTQATITTTLNRQGLSAITDTVVLSGAVSGSKAGLMTATDKYNLDYLWSGFGQELEADNLAMDIYSSGNTLYSRLYNTDTSSAVIDRDSGVTLKTINGESIIGSGDITISSGTGGITQTAADARYLKKAGDTCTGNLAISGQVAIGNTSFDQALHVNGAIVVGDNGLSGTPCSLFMSAGFQHNDPSPNFAMSQAGVFTCKGNITTQANLTVSGGASFGDPVSMGDALEVADSVTALSFYESSDASLKENITSITKKAVDAVDCLHFKQFNFKDDEDKVTKYGVIAQEVEAVGLSNLVNTDKSGTKSVDYISLLILKIEALEKRIAELEAERR